MGKREREREERREKSGSEKGWGETRETEREAERDKAEADRWVRWMRGEDDDKRAGDTRLCCGLWWD